VRHSNWELQIPKLIVHTVLHRCLHSHTDKLLLLQNITEEDKVLCFNFATCVLDQLAEDADYLKAVLFMDETTFHTSSALRIPEKLSFTSKTRQKSMSDAPTP
jgi:hypothetical protein